MTWLLLLSSDNPTAVCWPRLVLGGRSGGNNLDGTLPAELSSLSSVETLVLQHNPRLRGTIPSSIGQLVKLRGLSLAYAALSGPIPEALWQLTKLQNLYLWDNQLTSTISPHIGNLTKLQTL